MIRTRRRFLQGCGLVAGGCLLPHALRAKESADQPLVIVELFTSQGCSSCPPADRVLKDIVAKHEQEEYPVLGLSFHVDYWNYLGWSDPFSSAKWSARQRTYAKVLEDRVYTPQMIVNGDAVLVGSRRRELEARLGEHFERTPEHKIDIELASSTGGEVTVNSTVEGDSDGYLLNVAVVAHELTATAARGENAGRTLSHANVVRDFVSQRLTSEPQQLKLRLPKSDPDGHSLIAYIQNNKTAAITGAIEKPIA